MSRAHIRKHGIAEKYIEEVKVECKSPPDLLAAAGIAAAALDVLVIDAEGFDATIMLAFLKIPQMDPKLIKFEVRHLQPRETGQSGLYGPEYQALKPVLLARGYVLLVENESDAIFVKRSVKALPPVPEKKQWMLFKELVNMFETSSST